MINPPGERGATWLAGRLVAQARIYPKELTVEGRMAKRRGRVYIDTGRNAFGQTVVAPYSVRRRPKAPVSTPLDWAEVVPSLRPDTYNMANFSKRIAQKDPWADFFRHRQPIRAAIEAIRSL